MLIHPRGSSSLLWLIYNLLLPTVTNLARTIHLLDCAIPVYGV